MHQYFICKQRQIGSKLKTLTKSGVSEDGWTHYYFDKSSNEEWHLTSYDSEYHGGGIRVLKRLPEPTMEELVHIATTSSNKNDIIGASLELYFREKNNKEDFREAILNRILEMDTSTLSDFEKKRLKIIISESGLYDATNRRDIVGKHFTEIDKDANYYRTTAQKAKNILSKIEKLSS